MSCGSSESPISQTYVFGCKEFAHIPTEQRKKWDDTSHATFIIGYGVNGYHCTTLCVTSSSWPAMWFSMSTGIAQHRTMWSSCRTRAHPSSCQWRTNASCSRANAGRPWLNCQHSAVSNLNTRIFTGTIDAPCIGRCFLSFLEGHILHTTPQEFSFHILLP